MITVALYWRLFDYPATSCLVTKSTGDQKVATVRRVMQMTDVILELTVHLSHCREGISRCHVTYMWSCHQAVQPLTQPAGSLRSWAKPGDCCWSDTAAVSSMVSPSLAQATRTPRLLTAFCIYPASKHWWLRQPPAQRRLATSAATEGGWPPASQQICLHTSVVVHFRSITENIQCHIPHR